MDVNRNQFFMAGIVLLLLGIQFRWVETYELSEQCTTFLSKRVFKKKVEEPETASTLFQASGPAAVGARRRLTPPDWLGWALLSAAAVLILHSFAMPKPA